MRDEGVGEGEEVTERRGGGWREGQIEEKGGERK